VLEAGGIVYRHAVELGGRLAGEPGEARFGGPRRSATTHFELTQPEG
jgi:hypothetical protein